MENGKLAEGRTLSVWDIIKEEAGYLKWRMLVFACFVTFGSYYIYDFPGSIGTGQTGTIQAKFKDHGKHFDNTMNQALYSVYSWPNTVLAIFGGLLIDKFLGLRRALFLFTALITAGAVLFYIGVVVMNYPLMLFARVIFGLGGESLSVAQSAYVARWFKQGRGLALAFGMTLSFSRVGSSFNFLFSPKISNAHGVDVAVLCGVVACGISMISCIAMIWADVHASRVGILPPETKESGEPFKCSQLKQLPPTIWFITGICVFSYTSIFPFIGIAENYFQVKYSISDGSASTMVSFYQFASAVGSPVVGAIVDSTARNTYWMISATTMFMLVHAMFILMSIPGWIMMILLGFVYSVLASALWPAVPFAVDDHVVGFAYGMMTAMQNLGLAIFPLFTGPILDHFTPPSNCSNSTSNSSFTSPFLLDSDCPTELPTSTGFTWTELLFLASAGLATIFGFILLVSDLRATGLLSCSALRRREHMAEQVHLLGASKQVEEEKDGAVNGV